jgi:hypothetical protein
MAMVKRFGRLAFLKSAQSGFESQWGHWKWLLIVTRGDRGYCGKPRLQPR